MKNLIKSLLLGHTVLSTSASFASDYYVMLYLNGDRKNQLYTEIVKNTGLHKPQADNYHVTLAKIENVDPSDLDGLKEFLKKELRITCQKMIKDYNPTTTGTQPVHIEVQLSRAGRYTVNRTYTHCPVVLYFNKNSEDLLKDINDRLSKKLNNPNKFQSITGKKYTFDADTTPGTYLPHITVADTLWCDTQATHNRDHVIGKLNDHINAGIAKDKMGRDTNNKWRTKFLLTAHK